MGFRHFIRRAVLDSRHEVPISGEEYARLARARKILSSAIAIEEKYVLLVSNYLALEKQLLCRAADNAVIQEWDHSAYFESRTALNVCFVNLLTSARLYVDHLPQDIAECIPDDGDVGSRVKARFSQEYDTHAEYRLMEALRNYVQHRGLAVHVVRYGAQRTRFDEQELLEFTVNIFALRRQLQDDGKFKKSALNEQAAEIDLMIATRQYVECLSTINQDAREMVTESVSGARMAVENARMRFASSCTEGLIGLEAMTLDGDHVVSTVGLHLDWDDVRIDLQKRYGRLVNLTRRCVTGRSPRSAK